MLRVKSRLDEQAPAIRQPPLTRHFGRHFNGCEPGRPRAKRQIIATGGGCFRLPQALPPGEELAARQTPFPAKRRHALPALTLLPYQPTPLRPRLRSALSHAPSAGPGPIKNKMEFR